MGATVGDAAFMLSFGLLWVITLCLCVMVIATLRHLALLFEAVDPVLRFRSVGSSLRVGEPVPAIHLESADGDSFDLGRLVGSFVFVLVVQVGCQPCTKVLEGIGAELLRSQEKGWRTVVIVPGNRQTAAVLANEVPGGPGLAVFADTLSGTSQVWGIIGTPFGLVLDDQGRVQQKFAPISAREVREILTSSPGKHPGRPMRLADSLRSGLKAAGDNRLVGTGGGGG